jgi:hypothetical protein
MPERDRNRLEVDASFAAGDDHAVVCSAPLLLMH